MRVRDGSVFPLISLLESSRTTLFYFQPVEAGCWWLPALRFDRNCFGSYALRPSEFIASLNLVMEEIQKGPSPMTTSKVSAIQPSPIALPWPNTRTATGIPVRAERPELANSSSGIEDDPNRLSSFSISLDCNMNRSARTFFLMSSVASRDSVKA